MSIASAFSSIRFLAASRASSSSSLVILSQLFSIFLFAFSISSFNDIEALLTFSLSFLSALSSNILLSCSFSNFAALSSAEFPSASCLLRAFTIDSFNALLWSFWTRSIDKPDVSFTPATSELPATLTFPVERSFPV